VTSKVSYLATTNPVHPNVDKKSFIRWKQRDIHEKRAQRKQDIQDLKLSQQVNEHLLSQINEIIARLMMGGMTLDEGNIARAFQVDEKQRVDAPTGPNGPSYAQMLNTLFDEIRKAVAGEEDKKGAYIKQLEMHRKKIGDAIAKNDAELTKLEKEEKSKITSEGLHEGFSSSVCQGNTELTADHCETQHYTSCYFHQGSSTETQSPGGGSS
jgi:cell division cycle protein 37